MPADPAVEALARLWYDVKSIDRSHATVTLSRCKNCGRVKVLSDPCSLDHLAAILEFNACRAGREEA